MVDISHSHIQKTETNSITPFVLLLKIAQDMGKDLGYFVDEGATLEVWCESGGYRTEAY